jgi:hypothetical protein
MLEAGLFQFFILSATLSLSTQQNTKQQMIHLTKSIDMTPFFPNSQHDL